MQIRFILSDESTATLQVLADETVAQVTKRLLESLNKTEVTAHWMYLGSSIPPNISIAQTPLSDGCTVNVFLRTGAADSRGPPQVPSDYSSKMDQFLLRTLFVASFILFASASFARQKYPEAFTVFTDIALNVFWSLWAIALAANWRSVT